MGDVRAGELSIVLGVGVAVDNSDVKNSLIPSVMETTYPPSSMDLMSSPSAPSTIVPTPAPAIVDENLHDPPYSHNFIMAPSISIWPIRVVLVLPVSMTFAFVANWASSL